MRQKNEELGLYAAGAQEYVSLGYSYIRLPVSGVGHTKQELDSERESHENLLGTLNERYASHSTKLDQHDCIYTCFWFLPFSEQAEEIYSLALKRFPTASMNLLRAQVLLV
jgi:hypothetical protein